MSIVVKNWFMQIMDAITVQQFTTILLEIFLPSNGNIFLGCQPDYIVARNRILFYGKL